ncbi:MULTISPECIES: 2-oxoacid:acceptor oxidoreductase family protein [unclassified Petrotoga]|uniref:2-oxoacid:acceptor oxidoreductase family protein n=1 Tax=unclassified Petrotoga TaxID=2620614 RepID=UPI000EF16894|nr:MULTISPECIES: 2-oxoacid:acceptor oxidoreductase family protein [unclassified Petrotoga]
MSSLISTPNSVRFSGEAGQGNILMGIIFAKALVKEGFWVVQSQHYGAQVRGGLSYCDVLFDQEPIDYPEAKNFDILYLMHNVGLNHIGNLKRNGILFYDEKFVESIPQYVERITKKIIKVPASQIAIEEFSNKNVANMVGLGVLCSVTQIISLESLIEEVKLNVSKNYIEIDEKAIKIGYDLCKKRYPLESTKMYKKLGKGYE